MINVETKDNLLPSLSISIVLYRPELEILTRTLDSLHEAWAAVSSGACLILYLVDNNEPDSEPCSLPDLEHHYPLFCSEWIIGHGNIGYGKGHNLAISRTISDFHLVLNPDVFLKKDCLEQCLRFFEQHEDSGLVVPEARCENGQMQFIAKRYPSILVLFLRAWGNPWLNHRFRHALEQYEYRDKLPAQSPVEVNIASGCFMLFRTAYLQRVGGFSPNYFMYFEDFELSLRFTKVAKIMHLPSAKITHLGGGASTKNWQHIRMFMRSAVTFFRRNGVKLV